ncbi:MAG: nicotinate (nicotinamide) nucleotide adenylyltransferase [Verrucomicrobiota bacterium]
MSDPRKIALFGGTFDPVHLGHVHLAELAVKAMGLDEVRFLPCRISPHKTDQAPSSTADRLHLLRLATNGLPWAVVDDFEIGREGPSFSYQTAEAMVARFPGCRLYWIMGVDQWDALPRWAEPRRLAACVEFIVFSRGKTPIPREGYVMHHVEGGHPASATAIREALSDGETTHPWLHPDVARWISESANRPTITPPQGEIG